MSTDWEKAAAEIRQLQADWKTSGPVRRNKSEVVWQRFRTACDTFFDRYKRRDQIELEGKQADREALVAELEALAAEPPAEGRHRPRTGARAAHAVEPVDAGRPPGRRSAQRALRRRDRAADRRARRTRSRAPSSTSTPTASGWRS